MSSEMFSGIVGHERVLRLLGHAVTHPAQAYFFVGPKGVGKYAIAERFVRALLDHPAAASLASHPDFMLLEREEGAKEITVKQSRELLTRMQMTSAKGGKKVALILDAERLNEEAANALLKAVEEPPPHTLYLFVGEQPERLPRTLRSRLVTVPFERVPTQQVVAWLVGRGFSEKESLEVATLAHGAPGLALRWLEEGSEWRSYLASSIHFLETLHQEPVGVQAAALERIAKECESTDDPEAAWRERLSLSMRAWTTVLLDHPADAVRIGQGLVHASRLVGSSLSPRLGLEWSAIQPYLMRESSIPSFLKTPYL